MLKVGLATLAITALYEALLRRPLDQIDVRAVAPPGRPSARLRRACGNFSRPRISRRSGGGAKAKARHDRRTPARTRTSARRLAALRARLGAQLIPLAELKRRLKQVGAPTEPEEIGLTRERLRETFHRALHIRRRYTVLICGPDRLPRRLP